MIIRVFADCGLRLEELSRLTAGDLVRGGRQAHLRVHGKRDRIRDVPVPPSLIRRLERLIAPWQFGDVGLDDPPKWEKVATVPDDEVLGTFIALRVKDGVAFILRKGGSYRADVREHAKSVGVLGECFDEIAARINPAGWHERAPARVLRGEREPRQTPKEI